MANNKIILPGEKTSKIRKILDLSVRLNLGKGLLGLAMMLAFLSFLGSYEWKPAPRAYTAGEIASSDIASPFAFRFQDLEATNARKEAARRAQPLICVLDAEPVDRMQRNMRDLFDSVRKTVGAASRTRLRQNLSEETGEDFSERMLNTLMEPAVQTLVNNDVMPWLEKRLREGVLSESRILADYGGGIMVREGSGAAGASLTEISDVAAVRADLRAYLNGISANRLVNRVALAVLNIHIMPTLRPDFEATARSANEAVRTVRPVMQQVMAGEVIVRQGERISPAQLPKLHALLSHEGESFHLGSFLGVLICSLLLCGGLFISPTGRKLEHIGQTELLFIAFQVGFSALLAKALYLIGVMLAAYTPGFAGTEQVFAVPVAGLAAMVCTVFSIRRYYVINVLLAMFCTLVSKGGLPLFGFYFISALFGSWFTAEAQTRRDVIKSFFPLLASLIPLWLGTTLVMGGAPLRFLAEFPALLLGVMLSLFLLLALPPLIETLFGFTTRFSLMELMNQEHPVLRKLMFNAPGTYHHSLVVANMSEIAAEAIGAHSLLCKVGALYHDIGKADMPHYFVENQFRGENPHDRLTPAMSALVLISHVKRGVELATRYRLGKEVTDIIREHHGNRIIQYFYQKALALQEAGPEGGQSGGAINKKDFSYAGPRPQTRESALIMLADVVEASSRTLADPTPSRIKSHVHKMIRDVLVDGQLDSVDLTFRDLELVEDNFTMILTGMFHKRIEYPWQKKTLPKAELQLIALPAPAAGERPAAPVEAPAAETQPDAGALNGAGVQPYEQKESLAGGHPAVKWLAN